MKNRIINIFYNLLANFQTIPQKIILKIPFFSQWESRELVDKILSRQTKASEDPKWRLSGANTKQEYELWSWNLCGTACLKMILKYRKNKEFKLFELGRKITIYGGYIYKNSSTIDGLFYKPFVTFLKKEFNINSTIALPLTINRIKYEIARGNDVICSVNQNIRDSKATSPSIKSGHLVLITGYDQSNHLLYINNPSGYYGNSQESFPISETNFLNFFSGRGIIVYN